MDDRTEVSTVEEVLTEAAEAEAAVLDAGDIVAAEALAEGVEKAKAIEEVTEEVAEEIEVAAVAEGVDPAEADAEADEVRAEGDRAAVEVLADAVVEASAVEVVAEATAAAIEDVAEAAQAVVVEADAEAEVATDADADAEEEAAEPTTRRRKRTRGGPMDGPGDWYVVHTYAGYENRVKTNLASRIQSMQMQDKIFDVHIPMEDVMEIKGGKKQVVKKKVFPGYLLVKMIYDNDSWYVVRNTPGVTGFVSAGTGTKPTPLSRREVEKILLVQEEEVKKPAFRLEWEEGDVVRIVSGPFADFNGTISEINVDQSKLKVLVNIFDRETPVELGFDQVAKV